MRSVKVGKVDPIRRVKTWAAGGQRHISREEG